MEKMVRRIYERQSVLPRLQDEVGTRYMSSPNGGGGGDEWTWRAAWQFSPGLPEGISKLTIHILELGEFSLDAYTAERPSVDPTLSFVIDL